MTTTTTDLQHLADEVKAAKQKVEMYKRGHAIGKLTYDELAEAGKELSNAMFLYAKAKFPDIKPKRIPYQAIIR